jgi:hypothetical protein
MRHKTTVAIDLGFEAKREKEIMREYRKSNN